MHHPFQTGRALNLNELISKMHLNYRSIFAARQLIITTMNKLAFGKLNDLCSSANQASSNFNLLVWLNSNIKDVMP